MAAYAALISLDHTLHNLLNSHKISVVPHCREIIAFSYEEVRCLLNFLERCDRSSRLNSSDGQIRDALCELEDVIESHLSHHLLSHSSERRPLLFSLDLNEVRRVLDNFNEAVKKMKDEYIKELCNPLSYKEETNDVLSTSGNKCKLVGLSDQFIETRDMISDSSNELKTVAFLGMAGIGKTVLAKEVYECPFVLNCFDFRLWVRIGPKYELTEILVNILVQINPEKIDVMVKEGDYNLWKYVYESLSGRRYFIALDDIWDTMVWDCLKKLFPDDGNGSRVLVTTRIEAVASYASKYGVHRIRLLNKEESWDLLRQTVFGEMPCPGELQKAGKKIAENCEGLPLTIVTIGNLLLKSEKTTKYWNQVAEKENSLVFVDANDEMSKVLLRSYNYLPQRLKACFLYMGVFPQNHEIAFSKLVKLWVAEGFIERAGWYDASKYIAIGCLNDLVSKSLVMVRQKGSSSRTKTCSLHSSIWEMCVEEARKTKFYDSLNSRADGLAEGVESQRRFSIRNNILFNITDVRNSMASVSNTRSLLFTGSPNQYPVPICSGWRLLRVLDAVIIRFYTFPMEVLKLVQLRYLALTYDGELPSSISKLLNLEYLIVLRHLSIVNSSGNSSYLPVEIWDMQELKHLQIMGSDLPDPSEGRCIFSNITTLLDVSARSCTKGVLGRILQLKKLGLRIELTPNGVSLDCFDQISCLQGLETLKVFVVNPLLEFGFVVPQPSLLSVIPLGLTKLNLCGSGYWWEDMRAIASMPNLGVLKLLCYAFRGPEWRTYDGEFPRLHCLMIKDTDLEKWRVGYRSFPVLRRLSIKHCYKLEQIIWESYDVEVIEVVDCNSYTGSWAEQMQEKLAKDEDHFYVHSLFE